MKKLVAVFAFCIASALQAQQISVSEIARNARWSKQIDEVNNGKQKIKYSDIQGIPYYNANFEPARVGDTSASVPIRYNSFLDTVEILVNTDVYEIPREESYPKFIYEKSGAKLVLVNTHDELAGYFFELAPGKNRLLKKVTTKFHDAVPAPNSMIPGTPAHFEALKPAYFIKTEDAMIRIPKNVKDLPAVFTGRETEVAHFIKTNKIKVTSEPDLIKLNNFLNK